MPAPLPPDGTSLVVDANIFYYHFVRSGDVSEWSSDLLERVSTRRLLAFTSASCLAECIHKVMTAEAARRLTVARPSVVNFLRHHPEQIAHLALFRDAAAELRTLSIVLLPIDPATVFDATLVSRERGLLTDDAISVALMARHGLTHLATNDADFARVPTLTLWKPDMG